MGRIRRFESIEELKERFNEGKAKSEEITREAINGYIKKLKKLSCIRSYKNPENRKEKTIEMTYIGISFVLKHVFKTLIHDFENH